MTRLCSSVAAFVALWLAVTPGNVPVVAAGDPHAYFNALIERSSLWKAYSLRDSGQVLQYRAGEGREAGVTYDPARDYYGARQDAAKVVVPAGKNSLPNQLRLPLGTEDGHSYLLTWEAWFGPELSYANTGIINYKTFQVASDGLWFEVHSRFSRARGTDLAEVDGRGYVRDGSHTGRDAFGPNVTDTNPLPSVGSFATVPATWTRYWVQVEQRADDWDLVSLWVADETRDAVQLIDGVQLQTFGHPIDKFWFEFNTSTGNVRPDRGPLVSYVRNFVALRDAGTPVPLLQRPISGTPLPSLVPEAPQGLRIIPRF